MEMANGHKSEFISCPDALKEQFPGIDFSLLEQSLMGGDVAGLNGKERVPLFESKIDLMGRTDAFLRWIKQRDERVIVGKSVWYCCLDTFGQL